MRSPKPNAMIAARAIHSAVFEITGSPGTSNFSGKMAAVVCGWMFNWFCRDLQVDRLNSVFYVYRKFMALGIVAAALIVTWLTLVLFGKSGFVHTLLLTGLGVAFVQVLRVIRERVSAE